MERVMGPNVEIEYQAGYSYQLYKDAEFHVGIFGWEVQIDFASLAPDGVMTLHKGFAWNGASGGAIDTDSIIRASALHDALYRMMRSGLLPRHYRETADYLLREMYEIDAEVVRKRSNLFKGWFIRIVKPLRSRWTFRALRIAGESSTDPENKNPVLTAP